jgi:hypothetical protein
MSNTTRPHLWELPEVLLFQIISYVSGPTQRARVVCHQVGTLCKASHNALLKNYSSPLWSAILKQDYGAQLNELSSKRSSKRLKQSHLQRVRDAHKMTKDNTEIAYYYLTEMCIGSSKKAGLSRTKLSSLLEEYGPHLRINHLTSTGGTFLVECCRARNVRESAILRCVEELVERRGAVVNLPTNEQPPNSLTALCVASARAMPSVTKYLLQKGADPSLTSTGRFRLYTRPRRTVRCTDATPLEFASQIRSAEKQEGASDVELKDLDKVIRLLKKGEQSGAPWSCM